MAGTSQMVDMARTPPAPEKEAPLVDMQGEPDYPFGLCLCLTQDELDKLGLDNDAEIGDLLDIRAFAKVTSVSKNANSNGNSCRIEMQIIFMSVENEEDEGEDVEAGE